jgi:hypothetical protein
MRTLIVVVALAAAGGCEPAMKHIANMHAPPGNPHAAQGETITVDLQGGYDEWRVSPFIHQFYDLTKASFAGGSDKVDFAAYQEKSYAIFRAFGGSQGGTAGEEAMLDHLKDIPRQMVGIVKEDPHVLDTYDKFWIAMAGPP